MMSDYFSKELKLEPILIEEDLKSRGVHYIPSCDLEALKEARPFHNEVTNQLRKKYKNPELKVHLMIERRENKLYANVFID